MRVPSCYYELQEGTRIYAWENDPFFPGGLGGQGNWQGAPYWSQAAVKRQFAQNKEVLKVFL